MFILFRQVAQIKFSKMFHIGGKKTTNKLKAPFNASMLNIYPIQFALQNNNLSSQFQSICFGMQSDFTWFPLFFILVCTLYMYMVREYIGLSDIKRRNENSNEPIWLSVELKSFYRGKSFENGLELRLN